MGKNMAACETFSLFEYEKNMPRYMTKTEQSEAIKSSLWVVNDIVHSMNIYEQAKELYEYEDLLQIGRLELCKIAKSFNMTKKIKFSTYAYTCIKNMYISKFFDSRSKHALSKDRENSNMFDPMSVEGIDFDVSSNERTELASKIIKENAKMVDRYQPEAFVTTNDYVDSIKETPIYNIAKKFVSDSNDEEAILGFEISVETSDTGIKIIDYAKENKMDLRKCYLATCHFNQFVRENQKVFNNIFKEIRNFQNYEQSY